MGLFLDREVKVRQNEYNKDVQKEKNVEKSSEMRMFTVLASSTHTETELKSGQKFFLVACEELQKNETKNNQAKKPDMLLLRSNQLGPATTNQQCIVYLGPEVCPQH